MFENVEDKRAITLGQLALASKAWSDGEKLTGVDQMLLLALINDNMQIFSTFLLDEAEADKNAAEYGVGTMNAFVAADEYLDNIGDQPAPVAFLYAAKILGSIIHEFIEVAEHNAYVGRRQEAIRQAVGA